MSRSPCQALDVCLQQLTATLDEDLLDVDEYERGVMEPYVSHNTPFLAFSSWYWLYTCFHVVEMLFLRLTMPKPLLNACVWDSAQLWLESEQTRGDGALRVTQHTVSSI